MLGYAVFPAEGLGGRRGWSEEFLTFVLNDMSQRGEVGKHSMHAQMCSVTHMSHTCGHAGESQAVEH